MQEKQTDNFVIFGSRIIFMGSRRAGELPFGNGGVPIRIDLDNLPEGAVLVNSGDSSIWQFVGRQPVYDLSKDEIKD